MNILYITNHLNVGGITSYVLTLSKGMKKLGHNVFVASSEGVMLSEFILQGIEFIPIPILTKQEISINVLWSMLKLRGQIRKHHIELLHTNSRTTQVLGYLLSRECRVSHVWTCHGFFKKRLFRRLAPRLGSQVIAISQEVKEHLVKDFNVSEEKISLIYNGIDISRFSYQLSAISYQQKSALGLTDGPVIGIIARLSDVKGHIYLIEAMKDVLSEFPDAQLLIIGEGKMKDQLVALTEKLMISNSVFFRPEVRSTPETLAAMDIFVMPSLQEGLGLALMEAMSAGCAVIGSDVGGIKNLIQDGLNGMLVESKNSASLAQAIVKLLKNPDMRKKFGIEAKDFIANNFSYEKMVSKTEEVYRRCLGA